MSNADDYFRITQDTLHVDLWYPRCDGRPTAIEVGLVDVRAADGLRIAYDFDRDGWVIQQATRFSWGPDEEQNPCWVEVAFICAWASEAPDASGGKEAVGVS